MAKLMGQKKVKRVQVLNLLKEGKISRQEASKWMQICDFQFSFETPFYYRGILAVYKSRQIALHDCCGIQIISSCQSSAAMN